MEQQRQLTAVHRALAALETSTQPAEAAKKAKADLEEQLKQLQELQKAYQDPGPIHGARIWPFGRRCGSPTTVLTPPPRWLHRPAPIADVVVYHDGEHWRAVVDTAETGDLTRAVPMADYNVERQYGYLGGSALLTYAVHIYNDGTTCSLVTTSGSHGSHVAAYAGHSAW